MKLISDKPIAKRPRSNSKSNLTAVIAVGDASVKALALECWRIKKLVTRCQGPREQFQLQTSVTRMIGALADSGVVIEDPEGIEFRDGMPLNIAVFDFDDKLELGRRVVSETLSPHIYINNKLAHMARVIVSVGSRPTPPGA